MALWALFQGQNLIIGEEELMDYPLHIRRAFAWLEVLEESDEDEILKRTGKKQLYYGDYIRENVRRFIQRWGGLDEVTLLRVLDEAPGVDRIRAIFAIGYSPFQHALDKIAPFLVSANRIERSAVACVMCVQQDERAFPFLQDYFLHDDLNDAGDFIPEADSWYQGYYAVLSLILANWGPSETTEILRAMLIRIATPEHRNKFGHDSSTPANIYYALGRRGYFSALDAVSLSERGRAMALFSLAAGYLNAYELYEKHTSTLLYDESFQKEIVRIWQEQLEFSDQEIQECITVFNTFGLSLFHLFWWIKYEG